MQKYVYVGLGGILGAILRYMIKGIQIYHYHEHVPLTTLTINITGSFLLALILTVALEVRGLDAGIRLGITTGFLGAFTTFSTLCKEIAVLIYQGDYFSAISYMTVSIMMSLAAVYFAIILAREVVSKLVKNGKDGLDESEAEIEGDVE